MLLLRTVGTIHSPSCNPVRLFSVISGVPSSVFRLLFPHFSIRNVGKCRELSLPTLRCGLINCSANAKTPKNQSPQPGFLFPELFWGWTGFVQPPSLYSPHDEHQISDLVFCFFAFCIVVRDFHRPKPYPPSLSL